MGNTPRKRFRAGHLDAACSQLESESPRSHQDNELLATIDYLQGRYSDALSRFAEIAQRRAPLPRHRARRYLSLCYFQTNQFEQAAALPLRDPLTRLMRAFRRPPNLVGGAQSAVLPFTQNEEWALPRVAVTANGVDLVAMIDTGGDLFSLPWAVAAGMGIEPVARSTGWYAGGQRARTALAILDRLDLGAATIESIPVSLNGLDHPVIGTGLLRQFRPTVDYPNNQLLLERRTQCTGNGGIPFLLAGTHLLVAKGSINGTAMWFLVDSGLEVGNDGAFLAPNTTLAAAGIGIPEA